MLSDCSESNLVLTQYIADVKDKFLRGMAHDGVITVDVEVSCFTLINRLSAFGTQDRSEMYAIKRY